MGNCVVARPNEAMFISGCTGTEVVVGSCGCSLWFCNHVESLGLEIMTIHVISKDAETTRGVRIDVDSVAQLKVQTHLDADGKRSSHKSVDTVSGNAVIDKDAIKMAGQNFLGKDRAEIEEQLKATMEGLQRQILGTLTVEEIYKDRMSFCDAINKLATPALLQMGYELVSYVMTDIDDSNNYMSSLGKTQTALVMREAAEGQARNQNEARKKVAAFKSEADIEVATREREAHVVTNQEAEKRAEADRNLNLKRAQFDTQVNSAVAEAEAAAQIESAKQKQAVVRAETTQRAVEAEVELQIADKEVEREKKLREGKSAAELLAQKNRAEGIRVLAEAEAQKTEMMGNAEAQVGLAEAKAIKAKGEAEAEVLQKKADAYKNYGEAAMVSMVVEKLPVIAESVARPLGNVGKMVVVSNDGSVGSKLTGDIGRMISQLPEVVNGLTGVDITKAMKAIADKTGEESKDTI